MPVTALEVGDLATNCFIVLPDELRHGTTPCVVIDPGAEPERISTEIKRLGAHLEAVLLTHSHVDHIAGVSGLLAHWPDAILACSAETSRRAADARLNLSAYLGDHIVAPPAGRVIVDGEEFSAAGLDWRAVEVPGHDPGELVYILLGGNIAFMGDTVFAGSIGRSDFPGGDGRALVAGARALLASLDPETRLFPGHGPSTLAGVELASNPFLAGFSG